MEDKRLEATARLLDVMTTLRREGMSAQAVLGGTGERVGHR